jgi:hypothetical protein
MEATDMSLRFEAHRFNGARRGTLPASVLSPTFALTEFAVFCDATSHFANTKFFPRSFRLTAEVADREETLTLSSTPQPEFSSGDLRKRSSN